jgi:hypothetical protein
MKLLPELEAARSNLMNHDPSLSLDTCFGELLHEKQRLVTQATFQQDKLPTNIDVSAAQVKWKGKDMRKVQCYSCEEYGHVATHFVKKYCLQEANTYY